MEYGKHTASVTRKLYTDGIHSLFLVKIGGEGGSVKCTLDRRTHYIDRVGKRET